MPTEMACSHFDRTGSSPKPNTKKADNSNAISARSCHSERNHKEVSVPIPQNSSSGRTVDFVIRMSQPANVQDNRRLERAARKASG